MLTILVDGNAVGNAWHRATKLTVGSMQVQAIFGVIKSCHKLLRENPGAEMLVLWDGKPQFRYDLYPEYKGNRKAMTARDQAIKEAYHKQTPILRKLLETLGVRQMLVLSHEADDMAGLLSKRLSDKQKQVLLVTGDQDWLQLVNDYVSWFDPIRDNKVHQGNFTEFTGYFTPRAFLEGKAIRGDTSDNITGIDRIGEKTAMELMARFGSIEQFWALAAAGKTPLDKKYLEALASPEGQTLVKRNLKLMDLTNVPNPAQDKTQITRGAYNEGNFRLLCEKLAFQSILRDFSNFTEPFQSRLSVAA